MIHCAMSQSPCPPLFFLFFIFISVFVFSLCARVSDIYTYVCGFTLQRRMADCFAPTLEHSFEASSLVGPASKMAISGSQRYSCLCSNDEGVGACVPCLDFYFVSGD